jgi:hypothetical protein
LGGAPKGLEGLWGMLVCGGEEVVVVKKDFGIDFYVLLS